MESTRHETASRPPVSLAHPSERAARSAVLPVRGRPRAEKTTQSTCDGPRAGQLEYQPTGPDFDIVRVRPQTQEVERPSARGAELKRAHAAGVCPCRAPAIDDSRGTYVPGHRRQRRGRSVPDLPGRVPARVNLFELLPVLERVHRHPEAVVLVRHQPPSATTR